MARHVETAAIKAQAISNEPFRIDSGDPRPPDRDGLLPEPDQTVGHDSVSQCQKFRTADAAQLIRALSAESRRRASDVVH